MPVLESGDGGQINSEEVRTWLELNCGYSKLPCLSWHPVALELVLFFYTQPVVAASGFLLLV